jgi:cytochrome c peroxidase
VPAAGFADGKRLSIAIGTTSRNTQTVLNAAYNRWCFWDGKADSLWSQALIPMEDPREQGGSRLQFAHVIHDDPALQLAYTKLFGALPPLGDLRRFPAAGRPIAGEPTHAHHLAWQAMTATDQDGVNRVFANIGKAIAAYERRLIRRESPFDTYVAGLRTNDPAKESAISNTAKAGLKIFMGRGNCHLCHQGPNFSNLEFHSVGIEQRDWLAAEDAGRLEGVRKVLADPFNSAGVFSDGPQSKSAEKLRYLRPHVEQLGQFKVPSLRNVALTAPYMHGGQFESLERAVRFYSLLDETPPLNHREIFMKPLDLSDREIASVVAFLESLTGAPVADELLVQPPSPSLSQRE